MKTVYRSIFAVGIATFFVVMFVLVANFTKTFATTLYPNDLVAQYGAIFLADAGALIWLGTFVYWSKTNMQRSTAFIMFLFDLGIAGIMIAVNTLANLEVSAELTKIATFALALSGILNLAALYWYHMHSEDTQKEIQFGEVKAEFTEEALDALKAKKRAIAQKAADILGDRFLDEMLAEFQLSRQVISGHSSSQVIEGTLKDPEPEKEGLLDKIKNAVNGKQAERQFASETDPADAKTLEDDQAEPGLNPTSRRRSKS